MASYTTTTTTSNDEIFTSLKTPPLPPTKVNASCNHEIAHAVEETSTLESIHSFNSMNETVNLEEGREVKMNETNEGGENDEFMKPIQVTVLLPNNCKLTIPVLRADTVGFLLQSVVDHPSLVSYSCATLNHANQPLMEAQELGTIFKNQFDKTDEFSLTLTPSMYGERDVRVHLMRVRNLLYHSTLRIHPGHFALDTGISLFQSITAPHQITGDVSSIMNIPKNDTLGHPNGFQWDQAELGPLLTSSCVPPLSQKDTVDFGQEVSIGISGWNPPPAWRRIRGDFLYVQATFPHSQPLHITAFCKGFYKNRSTNEIFDPIADSPTFHSLLDLLSHFSPTFEKKLQTWLPLSTDIAPTLVPEKIPILTALPQANWQVTMSDQPSFSTDHVYDPLRGLGGLSGGETMLDTTAMDSVRDWNEEFQLYRTQLFSMTSSHPENFNGSSSALASDTHAPSTVTAASFVHFRHSTMVYTQFVHMAIQGALGILSGSIPPISLPDPTLFDSPRHPVV
ncbi:Intracellular distribution of mitochondria [Coelomomyces lativittatus]|nr:Intracellular distribution of mitochondria [Coelomomyces lativittatus]